MTDIDSEAMAQRPQTSNRDYAALRSRLESWLLARLPGATISGLTVPASNGMSSETVLFDVDVGDEATSRRLVARIAPDPTAHPVFFRYDMEQQFRTMEMVAVHTNVPVPRVRWLETDTAAIGAPFFVMEQVDGLVPPDVMPYTFGDNWLFDANRVDQERVERSAVEVLVRLHALSADGPARFLAHPDAGQTPLQSHVQEQQDYYQWVAGDGIRSPLIERGFLWLVEHWPAVEGPSVFNWGDARIGNMMFEDFAPVAVLDWEMASLGPREIDLGWMIYMHRVFQVLAEDLGMHGMPHLLRRDAVANRYAGLTGYGPRHLEFYTAYAALRYAMIMFRIARRQVTFGEVEMPDDPDHAILNHVHLSDMLNGRYWSSIAG